MKVVKPNFALTRWKFIHRGLCALAMATVAEAIHSQTIEVKAAAVADAYLSIGVRDGTIKVTRVNTLLSKYLSPETAIALKEGVDGLIERICQELDLRDPGPAYIFIDDGDSPGFSAVDGTLPQSSWPYKHAGVIVLGANFAGRLATDGTTSVKGFGVAVAVAHELAHIYQFRTGSWKRLLAVEGNRSRKRAELHADFLAGWLSARIGYRALDNIDAMARRLFDLGDQEVLDPNHHGTPGQRYAAMLRGFFLGASNSSLTASEASVIGEEFINGLLPLPQEE